MPIQSWNIDQFFRVTEQLRQGRGCELQEACTGQDEDINNSYTAALNELIEVCSIWTPPEEQAKLKKR